MTTTSQAIALRQAHPTWKLREIGDQIGVSRERVHQVLKRAGLETWHTPTLVIVPCDGCGLFITKARHDRFGFCKACLALSKWVTVLCAQCNNTRGIYRQERDSQVRSREHFIQHNGKPQERMFCSRYCRSSWAGIHYGFIAHPENIQRGNSGRPRLTHCQRGHPFSPENTSVSADGKRQCKACRAARDNARYHRLLPDAAYRGIRKSDG